MTTPQAPATTRQHRGLSGLSLASFGELSYWPSYHPGSPAELAQRLGATVSATVDENLNYLVLGDRRGTGRAEAKKKAQKHQAKAKQIDWRPTETVPEDFYAF